MHLRLLCIEATEIEHTVLWTEILLPHYRKEKHANCSSYIWFLWIMRVGMPSLSIFFTEDFNLLSLFLITIII